MNSKTLNDDELWKWMPLGRDNSNVGLGKYLGLIARHQLDKGYIAELYDRSHLDHSSIMENLSLCMPRRYFLEIQFCAGVYATFFGKVFPPLAPHVDQLAYIEWLLFTETGNLRYRDHLVHMFKVAFAGDQLMSMPKLSTEMTDWQFSSKHFQAWCKNRNIHADSWELRDKDEVIKLSFFLAALFHDFGYGYFLHRSYKERLFKVYQWLLPEGDPTEINSLGTQKLLQSLPSYFIQKSHCWLNCEISGGPRRPEKVSPSVLAGFFRDCLPLNHSIASTFFILDMAEKLYNAGALNDKLYVSFQLAAEAAMIHDMTKDNRWVHLKIKQKEHFMDCGDHNSVPLAMLLILADELSIGNRPTLESKFDRNNGILNYLSNKNDIPNEIVISLVKENEDRKIIITADRAEAEKALQTALDKLPLLKSDKNLKGLEILGYSIEVKSSR